VPRICHQEDHPLTKEEIEYLDKVGWLWQQLSPVQRSKIVCSVTDGTLRQGSGKHCFIAEAMNATKLKEPSFNHSWFDKILKLARNIFYDGPSYDYLLYRRFSAEDKRKLNDIYYSRIGDKEHQYQRTTELVRSYVTTRLITI